MILSRIIDVLDVCCSVCHRYGHTLSVYWRVDLMPCVPRGERDVDLQLPIGVATKRWGHTLSFGSFHLFDFITCRFREQLANFDAQPTQTKRVTRNSDKCKRLATLDFPPFQIRLFPQFG